MTDTAHPAPETTETDDAIGDEAKKARNDAIQVLARALWREGLGSPAGTAGGEETAGQGRAEWKEHRKDYVKLATRLFKRLDRQGATLTASPDKEADAD